MGEYRAALQAIEGGYGSSSLEELEQVLTLLWCHSRAEQSQFQFIWESVIADTSTVEPKPPRRTSKPEPSPEPQDKPLPAPSPQPVESVQPQPALELAPLPIRAPFTPVETEDTPQVGAGVSDL